MSAEGSASRQYHASVVTSNGAGMTGTLRRSARDSVREALARAIDSGRLPDSPAARAVEVEVARPANPEHGDLASNVALRLAKPMRMAPSAIAAALVAELTSSSSGAGSVIAAAEAAGAGFVNLHFADGALEAMLDRARRDPAQWGRATTGADGAAGADGAPGGDGATGRHVNVEFVSANPTGPLTVGNARGAFVGDLLSRVLEAGGQRVTREYYFNDSGAQVANLGKSIIAIREGREVPEDGYHGEYVVELAPELRDDVAPAGMAEDERAWAAGRWASDRIRAGIEASLANLGVRFDVWTTEQSLYDGGWVDRSLEKLRAGGHLYEQDGATWFRSTAFGDDKDRVLIRSDGEHDLLRGRHRLRRREVQPWLRPPDLHLGRRPSRHGRAQPQCRRGDGLRQEPRRDDPHRLGPFRGGRQGALDVEAGRDVHRPRRPPGGARRRRRPLVLREPWRERQHGGRPGGREEAVEREPGLLRAVRARANRLDPAKGGRHGPRARCGARGQRPARGRARRARWRESPLGCRR